MPEFDADGMWSRVNKIDGRVTKLEESRVYMEEMIKRSVESNEKLAGALTDMAVFMQKTNDTLDMQSSRIKSIGESVDNMSKRMDEVEEKSKFDMLDYFRKNLPWIIMILGLGMAYASKFFKA